MLNRGRGRLPESRHVTLAVTQDGPLVRPVLMRILQRTTRSFAAAGSASEAVVSACGWQVFVGGLVVMILEAPAAQVP